ncbi:hypothetical protein ACH3XW_10015 [Acanthocheilonema viteae]
MALLGDWRHIIFQLILFAFAVQCSDNLKKDVADSWGTEFIFIIPPNKLVAFHAFCYIFAWNKNTYVALNIEYTKIDNAKVTRKMDSVEFRSFRRYDFENLVMMEGNEGLQMLGNDRIHIIASEKISLTCYTYDHNSFADMFLVHPVGMGGDFYAFSLPGRSTMTLYLLPLGATNETISQSYDVHSVSLKVRQKNKIINIKQDMKAGSLWQYRERVEQTISIWIHDELNNTDVRKSVQNNSIIKIARMIVIASIRDIAIAGTKKNDFACFMPTPMIVDRCARLTNPTYHPARQAFAHNLLFTAPSHLCPEETIDIKSDLTTEWTSLSVKWDEDVEEVSMKKIGDKSKFIMQSGRTMMNIINYGGSNGIYLHEIPEYSQWISDESFTTWVPPGFIGAAYALMASGETPSNLSLYKLSLNTHSAYRLSFQGKFTRYLPIIIGEGNGTSIGYIPAINLRHILQPIFAAPTTIAPLTTTTVTETVTAEDEECIADFAVINSSTKSPTSTRIKMRKIASLMALSNSLFAICICFMAYSENEQ